MRGVDRRRFLGLATAVGVTGPAGCVGVFDGGSGDSNGTEPSDGGAGESEATTTAGGEPSTWEGTYGNDDFQTFLWGVTPTSDGGYLATGSQGTPDASNDGLLVKATGEGEEEWLETFSGPGWDWVNTAVETDDGYVGVGTRTSDASPRGAMWLMSVEDDGDENWHRTYSGAAVSDAAVSYGWSVAPTGDGGYLVVGRTSEDLVTWRPLVVKADAEGDEDWRESYLPDSAAGGRFQGVQATDDGFLLTGDVVETAGDRPRGVAVAIDAAGDERWRETYAHGRLGRALPVVGGYLVSGIAHLDEGRYGWLLNVDGDGAERWSETYERGSSAGITDVVPAGGALGAADSYVAVGWWTPDSNEDETGWLLQVDREGTTRAETSWDEFGASNVSAVDAVADGAYVVAGFADEDGFEADEHHAMGRLVVTTDFDLDA